MLGRPVGLDQPPLVRPQAPVPPAGHIGVRHQGRRLLVLGRRVRQGEMGPNAFRARTAPGGCTDTRKLDASRSCLRVCGAGVRPASRAGACERHHPPDSRRGQGPGHREGSGGLGSRLSSKCERELAPAARVDLRSAVICVRQTLLAGATCDGYNTTYKN